MKNKTQLLSKSLIGLLAFSLIMAGCTKKRDATLSDKDAPDTFAISEFGEVQDVNSPYTVQTEATESFVSKADSAKADNEVGKAQVGEAKVPARLQFMFEDLQVSGQAGQNLPITFGVEKDFVTAYKIVTSLNGLSAIEKEYAISRDEVVLSNKLTKSKNKADRAQLLGQLRTIVQKRDSQKLTSQNGTYLVPIFKYAVVAYGVVLRTKNEIGEETSSLTLQKTDWASATHLQISARKDDLSKVQFDPNVQDEVDRTFAASKLDRKIMTAADLRDTFQVPTALDNSAVVLTNLDDSGLHVDEISQIGKLDQSQKDLLKSGGSYNKIMTCSKQLRERLAKERPELVKDCVVISRFVVPVKFVKVKIPLKEGSESQTARLTLDEVSYGENVGLVSIPKNVQPTRIQTDDVYDSESLMRVSDFKNKEFFFRRTLEDAPQTASFMIGEAGAVQIVKFEMQDARLVVRRADNLVVLNGNNDLEKEDLMSIPVTYLRREMKDARGTEYAYPKLVVTNKESAEYAFLKWSQNTLPATNSPVAYYGNGSCFNRVADTVVQDVDNRFDKGVMNFTFGYSVALNPSEACVGVFDGVGTYSPGDTSFQLNARLKERISFKLNDGSTDQSYVPQTPFRAQNALGYGVWTMGKIKPDVNGVHGREGSQTNLPVVQDFRNGKKLVYTLTGMPTDAARKKLYVDTTREIVEAWNSAYKRAFKGTSLERNGDYLELQVSGENGLDAHIGDLDRNIIHFDNKLNENSSTLGVSQVGVNERSGIVVADSLIIFAGNLEQYVGSLRRNLKISNDYKARMEEFKKKALAELNASDEAAKAAPASNLSAETKTVLSSVKSRVNSSNKLNVNQVQHLQASAELKNFIRERQALGKSGKFAFGSSQMENSYVERVFRKLIETSDVDEQDIEGLVAQEMLVSMGSKMTSQDKFKLQRRAGQMNARNQRKAQFKNKPGCMLTMRESLGKTFVEETFEQTFKKTLYFDLGHEMGHSQGLTHNFIGSFDKANFADEGIAANVDASTASRNYSSIMDYFSPPQFKWDGIGSYDVAALRASHLGLFELSNAGLTAIKNAKQEKAIVADRFIHINTIQSLLAPKGWSSFTAAKVGGLIRPYKYCTDIDVGYEPVCQRFDLGTSAVEVVENLIEDYNESYINNYHGWDRLDFGMEAKMGAVARTQRTLISMRQFLDEAFYKAIVDKSDPSGFQDYAQAAVKVYLFLNQLIHTPDANSAFLSDDRFVAVTIEATKDKDGKIVKPRTVAIIEKRALSDIQSSKLRFDTLGIELDKVLAMQVLTLKGLSYYKYDSNSIEFSFMDFEKYMLGMTLDNSLIMNTMKSMFLDKLEPTFSLPDAPMQKANGLKASVSSTMRAYAGISSILSLEASTLKDKDNFANYFKVASVIGTPPSDRISLTQLGVSNKSQTRLSYYALDNATGALEMLQTAAAMDFILRNEELDQALFGLADVHLDNFIAQVQGKKDQFGVDARRRSAKTVAAKKKLVETMIAQNKNGGIMSEAQIKANPALGMENLSNIIDSMIQQVLGTSIGSLVGNAQAKEAAPKVAQQVNSLADEIPLFGSLEKAILKAVTAKNIGTKEVNLLDTVKALMTSSEATDVKYGIIMKNIEFLNRLTRMTNPEYSR